MLSRFIERRQEQGNVWSAYFTKPAGYKYTAGDYTELELDYSPHGGRRWFSLSSAPSDKELRITFKLPTPHSKFKEQLMSLANNQAVQIAPPMGNFNLPSSPEPVLFIAIGIGVTPYVSIVTELMHNNDIQNWDITMVQTASDAQFLFDDVFNVLGKKRRKTSKVKPLKPRAVAEFIPDFDSRLIYLAGPEIVTGRLHKQLSKKMPLGQLRLSYFPGYKRLDT